MVLRNIRKLVANPELWQFTRFVIVGGVNTVFGLTVYSILIWLTVPPQPALAVAFAIGVVWNFFTHARFVFAHKGFRKFIPYIGTYLCIYFLNSRALEGLLSLEIQPILAQVICAPFAAMLAFLGIGRVLTGRFPIFGSKG